MKAKNSEKRARRWLPRIGIALVLLPFLVPVMMLSYIFGMFYIEDDSPTPMDALVGGFTALGHTPSYTILQDEALVEARGTLYLAGWIKPTETRCLAVIRVGPSGGIEKGYAFAGSIAECALDRYSINQYWTGGFWDHEPFSVAYGYSGDAERIVVTWQDKSVTRHTPVNGTYLAIHDEKQQVIRSVDFYSASGSLIYSLPDSKRSEIASRRSGT